MMVHSQWIPVAHATIVTVEIWLKFNQEPLDTFGIRQLWYLNVTIEQSKFKPTTAIFRFPGIE